MRVLVVCLGLLRRRALHILGRNQLDKGRPGQGTRSDGDARKPLHGRERVRVRNLAAKLDEEDLDGGSTAENPLSCSFARREWHVQQENEPEKATAEEAREDVQLCKAP